MYKDAGYVDGLRSRLKSRSIKQGGRKTATRIESSQEKFKLIFEMPECYDRHDGLDKILYKVWLDKILAFTAMVVSSGDITSIKAVEETIRTIAIEKIKNR